VAQQRKTTRRNGWLKSAGGASMVGGNNHNAFRSFSIACIFPGRDMANCGYNFNRSWPPQVMVATALDPLVQRRPKQLLLGYLGFLMNRLGISSLARRIDPIVERNLNSRLTAICAPLCGWRRPSRFHPCPRSL